MRCYRIAFFVTLIAAVLFGGAAVYLWYQTRHHPGPMPSMVNAGSTTATAVVSGTGAGPAQAPESDEPKLLPIQLTPQRIQSIGVKTGLVEFTALNNDIRTTGNVAVDETRLAWVQVRFSGWIQQVFADATYQHVEKGQRLLTMYSPEIAATEHEYLLARSNRDILGRSTVPGVASGSDSLLAAAAERLKQWQIPDREIAQLENGGAVPKEIEIDSPATGVITERNAFATAYVQPGTKLYTIADLSTVWVDAQVFQADIERIKLGDPATITTDAWPGRSFRGRVNFIYPQVDETTRTVKVRIEIPNAKMQFSLGMFVRYQPGRR
jgi:Cu(I)/Ag(I) efflux system membrane fusion protein/cobalt-zinc-cadmium efflux system membrane fusion protein